jgi:hypothetical protein
MIEAKAQRKVIAISALAKFRPNKLRHLRYFYNQSGSNLGALQMYMSPSEKEAGVQGARAEYTELLRPFNRPAPTPFPDEHPDGYRRRVLPILQSVTPGFNDLKVDDYLRGPNFNSRKWSQPVSRLKTNSSEITISHFRRKSTKRGKDAFHQVAKVNEFHSRGGQRVLARRRGSPRKRCSPLCPETGADKPERAESISLASKMALDGRSINDCSHSRSNKRSC